MERSAIRDSSAAAAPDYAALHPGYDSKRSVPTKLILAIWLRGGHGALAPLPTLRGCRRCERNCVTIESRGDFYTLFVDSVGDVITLPRSLREGNPATLDAVWRDVADAVYRTDQGLLVALHVDRLLAIQSKA